MKKFISILGVIFLSIIVILNLLFTAVLDSSEHISISFNSFIYFIGIILIGISLYFSAKFINNYLCVESKQKFRRIVFISSLIIYILFSVIWLIVVKPPIIGDTGHVCDLAETFFTGDSQKFLPNSSYAGITMGHYMQGYHQQIPLAFIFSIFFRICNFAARDGLRILNFIGNMLIVFSIYKINKQLSKKYETNRALLFILILTFISLPMLATFVYGDIPSLGLCMLSVYFMMRYRENKQIKYAAFSTLSMMFAYMMRMNSLIFIIATVMYLLLSFIKEFKQMSLKKNFINIFVVLAYVVISILPSSLIKNYYLVKYNMDKNKSYPNVSYFLMAMEESPRGNGWYNEKRGEYALANIDTAKDEYVNEIKERLKYFSENIGYTFEFYTMKMSSMWTENTYSAINVNTVGSYEELENISGILEFYQKVLLIIICLCSIIVLIQRRKNISLDVIFLVTIFIGGFMFHILWEAKSRYIIPYVVVLIPIASINIQNIGIKEKICNLMKSIKNI